MVWTFRNQGVSVKVRKPSSVNPSVATTDAVTRRMAGDGLPVFLAEVQAESQATTIPITRPSPVPRISAPIGAPWGSGSAGVLTG